MSIPKIIHYFYDDVDVWEKGKNPHFRMCLCSWKRCCPDYTLMLWHDKHPEFQKILNRSLFARKAYELKLWAFVADYVRLYALYKYGGIYLDTDVELLNNFDAFLNDGFFCSIEGDILNRENVPEPAVMGCTAGHPLLKTAMSLYEDNKIFEQENPIANVMFKTALQKTNGFSKILFDTPEAGAQAEALYAGRRRFDDFMLYLKQKVFRDDKNKISIYPSEYFCPTWCVFKEKAITARTVAIHWNQSSWWKKDVFGLLRNSICPQTELHAEDRITYKICRIPVLKIIRHAALAKYCFLGVFRLKKTPLCLKFYLGFIPVFKVSRSG